MWRYRADNSAYILFTVYSHSLCREKPAVQTSEIADLDKSLVRDVCYNHSHLIDVSIKHKKRKSLSLLSESTHNITADYLSIGTILSEQISCKQCGTALVARSSADLRE